MGLLSNSSLKFIKMLFKEVFFILFLSFFITKGYTLDDAKNSTATSESTSTIKNFTKDPTINATRKAEVANTTIKTVNGTEATNTIIKDEAKATKPSEKSVLVENTVPDEKTITKEKDGKNNEITDTESSCTKCFSRIPNFVISLTCFSLMVFPLI